MSSDADNVVSTKEITEQEIRHKVTSVVTETSHSSQSQVIVENVQIGVVTDEKAVEDEFMQNVTSCQEAVNIDQQSEKLEAPIKENSKETQTEHIESQSAVNMEVTQSETDIAINDESEISTREVMTNGYHEDETMPNSTSENILKKEKDHCPDAGEILKSVCTSEDESHIDNGTLEQSSIVETENDNSRAQTEEHVLVVDEAKEQVNTTTAEICSANIEVTNTVTENQSVSITHENDIVTDHGEVVDQSEHISEIKPNTELTTAEDDSVNIKFENEIHPTAEAPSSGLKLDKIKTKVRDVPLMNGFHASEIKEENLKSQLKEIISEIDLQVKKDEESEAAYYHTWHPKGEYTIEKTDIEYKEIVPVSVPDILMEEKKEVKEPLKKPKPKSHPTKLEKPMELEKKQSGGSNCSTPIEIPEGVPLLARMLPKEGENDGRDKIPLERLFTPASDSYELDLKKKKMYSSSSFYRPDHPTIEDQVHLAHKISYSLIADNNKESKGQSMYMKRKTKSTKWAHTGSESGFHEGNWQPNESDLMPPMESKEPPALKLLLNPKGIHDYNSIQNEQYNESATMTLSQYQLSGIGVGREIATDLQSPTGKGAALFAKRKKRMDKFIVDETNVQKALVNKHEHTVASSTVATVNEQNSHSAAITLNGTTTINNTPSFPGSRNLPDLSNILTQHKSVATKSILSTSSKGKAIKRSNTVSFPALDRGFPHRTPTTPSTRERRSQIKSWGSQTTNGISVDSAAGSRQQAQKRFSHIELNSTPKHFSPDGRPLDYGKKQKTNTVYKAEVKVEEKAAMTPSIMLDFNGVDPSHYLDIAMDNQEKRRSFNLAAKGWGTYHNFYTPLHLGTTAS